MLPAPEVMALIPSFPFFFFWLRIEPHHSFGSSNGGGASIVVAIAFATAFAWAIT